MISDVKLSFLLHREHFSGGNVKSVPQTLKHTCRARAFTCFSEGYRLLDKEFERLFV